MGVTKNKKAKGKCLVCKVADNIPTKYLDIYKNNKDKFLCSHCRNRKGVSCKVLVESNQYYNLGNVFLDIPNVAYFPDGNFQEISNEECVKFRKAYVDHFKEQEESFDNIILDNIQNLAVETDFNLLPFGGYLVVKDPNNIQTRYSDGDMERATLEETLLRLSLGNYRVIEGNPNKKKKFFKNMTIIFKKQKPFVACFNSYNITLSVLDINGKVVVPSFKVSNDFKIGSFNFSVRPTEYKKLENFVGFCYTREVIAMHHLNFFHITCNPHPEDIRKFLKSVDLYKDNPIDQKEIKILFSKIYQSKILSQILNIRKWMDPYCGHKTLVKAIETYFPNPPISIITNDIEHAKEADYHFDALFHLNYNTVVNRPTGAITSPPGALVKLATGIMITFFDTVIVHNKSSDWNINCCMSKEFFNKVFQTRSVYKILTGKASSFLVFTNQPSCQKEIRTL